jgi:hypothetical protein
VCNVHDRTLQITSNCCAQTMHAKGGCHWPTYCLMFTVPSSWCRRALTNLEVCLPGSVPAGMCARQLVCPGC